MSRSLRSREVPGTDVEEQEGVNLEDRRSRRSTTPVSSSSGRTTIDDELIYLKQQLRQKDEIIRKMELEQVSGQAPARSSLAVPEIQNVATLREADVAANTDDWIRCQSDPRGLITSLIEGLRSLGDQIHSNTMQTLPSEFSPAEPVFPVRHTSTRQRPAEVNVENIPAELRQSTQAARGCREEICVPSTRDGDYSQMNALMARQSAAKDLPTFGGSPYEWPTFKGQFEQSTALCNLSSAENLIRLQRALTGRAREKVQSLLVDPSHVDSIMRTLETHFGHPEILVNAMLEKLRDMSRLPEDASTDCLMDYATLVSNIVATVDGIGSDYLATPQVLSQMVGKLPACVRILWLYDNRGVKKCTIREFATWMEFLFSSARYLGGVDTVNKEVGKLSKRRTVLLNQTESNSCDKKPGNKKNCVQCDGLHALSDCPRLLKMSVQARWFAIKKYNLCFVCLEPGHRGPRCSKKKCGVDGCVGKHHQVLHKVYSNQSNADTVMNIVQEKQLVLLKVLPVRISGPKGIVKVYALLDEASSVTLMDESIARDIGVCGPKKYLRLHGANGMRSAQLDSRRVKINICGDGSTFNITVNTVKSFDLPSQTLKDARIVKPRVLLGQDNAHVMVPREVTEVGNGMFRSRTALGWTTYGGMTPENGSTILLLNNLIENVDDNLHELVKKSFAVDALGISLTGRTSSQDVRAIAIMEKTTRQLPSGGWETGLIWKDPSRCLPDNRQHALKRLLSLEKRFDRDPELKIRYNNKMKHLLEMGYVRKLEAEEIGTSTHNWYLPHFAVTNSRKPGKIRIVFDAASRYGGTSLNENLLTGPDLLSSLMGNILRFREGRIAIAADVKEMFLQIRIKAEDQFAQLFWWRDESMALQTFMLKRMMFGARCSPSSAQFVRNKVAGAHEKIFPAGANAVKHNFYMDDYLDAADDPGTAITLITEVTEVLRRGGFELANWAASDPSVLANVPRHLHAGTEIEIFGDATGERVLGIIWDTARDTFVFRFTESDAGIWPTKRSLLRAVMMYFDPIGFVACLLIQPKILLQAVWRSQIGWDDPIKPEHRDTWMEWVNVTKHIHCAVPRCCVRDRDSGVTLHMFADASQAACCAVAYFVKESSSEGIHTAFVAAKCKVAPLRPLSIPRLELQAALMAARLAATIKGECRVNITRTIYWTDSTTVLCWVRTDPRRYSSFVANRLGEIDELTNAADWKWVPTKDNPADIGTRDVQPLEIDKWFNGPSFLTLGEDEWPIEKRLDKHAEEAILEVKNNTVVHILAELQNESLPDISRFSSWMRLIRSTAWMNRFIARCRRNPHRAVGETLTADEIMEAERAWCRKAQVESFNSEIRILDKNQSLPKGSKLRPLSPVIDDDGIIRMGTRLCKGDLSIGIQAPIILDGAHVYTQLMVHRYHIKAGHPSTEKTASDLREDFYIIKLRPCIRGVNFRCQKCRIEKTQPKVPLMGQLPAGRLAAGMRPFTHCGLDFFGPMVVVIGRRVEKRYGALFTCMTTRAIHIELAHSLSSDSAIMALRRMTARRGYPEYIYSDNGTNFHGANREMANAIKKLQETESVLSEMANKKMTWKFNPPLAPHMGGVWERLVRSVKRGLTSALNNRSPREETLLTVLAEVEYTINSRPLTHVSVDPRDEEPLTPNHFLLGSASGRPSLAMYKRHEQEVCLRKQWQVAQQIADMFWRRWTREYLPTLAQRKKWMEPADPLKEGDFVIIVDSALPRNCWPRGRVVEAQPAADGQVRMVKVKTATGILCRPAVKVAAIPTTRPE